MIKGLVIGGEFGNVLIRQKSSQSLELGELLVVDAEGGKMVLQVVDLVYGSQLPAQQLELVSGLKLEENGALEFLDGKLQNYVLARVKNVALISNGKACSAKLLPMFFSSVRELSSSDVSFLTTPSNALLLGHLRSGSKTLASVPVAIDGRLALSHHVLIAGTTGRGKSVLMKNILWETLGSGYSSMIVFDPHNEYVESLRTHVMQENLLYFTVHNPPPGARSLKISLSEVLPRHFDGVYDWSDAQRQAVYAYYKAYDKDWIEAVVLEKELKENLKGKFHESTLAVVKRTLMQLLGLDTEGGKLVCLGVFDSCAGQRTIADIVLALDKGCTVIVDTSSFHGSVELLVGSLIAHQVLERRRRLSPDEVRKLPIASIVLEEAPRVLGKEVLERGQNVFAQIAREGRKFNVGLIAITQLPSLIPREILANLNTKIILGIELRPERQAIIESAAQDLSSDDRMIASLDKGEAIVTSNFLSFAMPIRVPKVQKYGAPSARQSFGGLKVE